MDANITIPDLSIKNDFENSTGSNGLEGIYLNVF
jgi:hypothetical protein